MDSIYLKLSRKSQTLGFWDALKYLFQASVHATLHHKPFCICIEPTDIWVRTQMIISIRRVEFLKVKDPQGNEMGPSVEPRDGYIWI